MVLRGSRTVALITAIATLISNIVTSILFKYLPVNPYHLTSNYTIYLHLANVLSVFGIVGAFKQHALSISIFSNYVTIDTFLSLIPRFLLITYLPSLGPTTCSDANYQSPSLTISVTPQTCLYLLTIVDATLYAYALAATILQIIGAVHVRHYANLLFLSEEIADREGDLEAHLQREIEERNEGGLFLEEEGEGRENEKVTEI